MIKNFSKQIIEEVFKWVEFHHDIFHDLCSVCNSSCITKYDRFWFNFLEQRYDIDSYKIMNVANFFNIPKLINLCSCYIAEKFETKNKEFIFSLLIDNNEQYLPFELVGFIYFQLLLSYSLIGTPNKQINVLEKIAKKKHFSILIPNYIRIKYSDHYVNSEDFVFFHELHNLDYVDVSSNNFFLKYCYYTNIKLNLNIDTIENILSKYINFNEDICILAGGFFSKHQQNVFAELFFSFCIYFLNKQDINIFLLDHENQK